ncbi:MAG: hypothetical protein ACKPJO_02335 [Dolichospermum sp.]
MDLLKYYLEEIEKKRLFQWQIKAALQPFLSFDNVLPNELKIQVQPWLVNLSEEKMSSKHKAKIAEFVLGILVKYQESKNCKESTENFF